MAIWDIITGKTYTFNSMLRMSDAEVCRALKQFVSHTQSLLKHPSDKHSLLQVRNDLYAFYFSASSVLSAVGFESSANQYQKSILALNSQGFLRLVCALHMGHVVAAYSEPGESLLGVMFQGVCTMYGRSNKYRDNWTGQIACLAESKVNPSDRLLENVYDEIAPILGLPDDSLTEPVFWGSICAQCVQKKQWVSSAPAWEQVLHNRFS